MQPNSGSRDYHETNYKDNCLISGVSYLTPLVFLENTNTLLLRSDLVSFCREYLTYKVNLLREKDIAIRWSHSYNDYPISVYRETLNKDVMSTLNVIDNFKSNFLLSESEKITYE